MNRCLAALGALPNKLVWDREGAIHAGGGRPTEAFAGYCGRLALGWVILDPGDAEAKGALERDHRFVHGNFEAGRLFANQLDFQAQLDGWSARINGRVHRTTRAVVSERLAAERERMRPLPAELPDADRRFVVRVAPQPYLRFDRNDYSLDPAWSAGGSRSAPLSARSLRSRSIPASSAPATAASSRAGSPSPTPPTSGRSSACAASAGAAAQSPRSNCARWPATTA
jgi:hypothetical protein